MRFNPHLNKKTALISLLLLNSGAIDSVVADQKNVSKVEMPAVDDPCNVGVNIYSYCQNATKNIPTNFHDCMEKIDIYSTRAGDKCCPDPDPKKDYYDCEPVPEDKRALYIASTVGPFAAVLGCMASICCWKNRNKLKEFVTFRFFHEYNVHNEQLRQTVTPLISDSTVINQL